MTNYWKFDFNIVRYKDDPFTEYQGTPVQDRSIEYIEEEYLQNKITVLKNSVFDFYIKKNSNIKNIEAIYIEVSNSAYIRINGSYQNLPVAPRLFLTNDVDNDEITSLKLVNLSNVDITFNILLLGTDTEFTGISQVF